MSAPANDHENAMMDNNASFPPLRRERVKHPAEQRIYDLCIYQPHVFTLAINQAYPQFANRYAVNIGAGDGIGCNDPVYPLYQQGFGGLAIEADDNAELAQNLPSDAITKVLGTFVTPINAASLLSEHGCPQTPDFFKLDIDGYDGPVLLEILRAGYRPKVMQIEINPEIPPPIEFAVLYDPDYRPWDAERRVGGFYSASLAYIANLTRRFGYRPVQIDFITPFTHDVTLVHQDYAAVVSQVIGRELPSSLRELFLAHPPGYSHFAEYGIDSFAWRYREDYHALLGEIWKACLAANQAKHGKLVPFHLSVSGSI